MVNKKQNIFLDKVHKDANIFVEKKDNIGNVEHQVVYLNMVKMNVNSHVETDKIMRTLYLKGNKR